MPSPGSHSLHFTSFPFSRREFATDFREEETLLFRRIKLVMPSRTTRRIRSALHLVLSDFDNNNSDANIDNNESTASTRGTISSRASSRSSSSCGPKPIYIYPGLLRIVRHSAIALDARCPASIYKPDANELDSCAICLEHFHARDLIRRLPCNKSHIFHSLCLLKWLKNNDRCPLCMDTVSAHPVKRTVKIHQVTPPPQVPAQLSNQSSSTTTTGTTTEESSTTSSNSNKASELKPPVPKQKKGPRTYSYIVHDAVRMQVDLAG